MRAQSFALLLPLAAMACGTTDGNGGGMVSVDLTVPGLTDVNLTSATAGQFVAPTDYAGGTSAWYFGRST